MEIRKAELKDLDTLTEFTSNVAFETEGKILDPETARRGVRTVLENPKKGVYYVAEIDGSPVGCLMINLQWVDWQDIYIYYIQSVYTKKDYRGRGVFKSLYHYVFNEAKENSAALRLYADSDNLRAIEVYKRLGMSVADFRFFDVEFAFSS